MERRGKISEESARTMARVFKALGHPVRLMIVDALSRSSRYHADFRAMFHITQPSLSRHVATLKQAGLVTEYRRGPRVELHLATSVITNAFKHAREVARADHVKRKAGVSDD